MSRWALLAAVLAGCAAHAAAADPRKPPDLKHVNALLQAKLASANRVRVLPRGVCCTRPEDMTPLLDTRDAVAVAELAASIEVDPSETSPPCECCGGPCLEFYAGEQLLTWVTIQHWRRLRGPMGERADIALTRRSLGRIARWLHRRGVGVPKGMLVAGTWLDAKRPHGWIALGGVVLAASLLLVRATRWRRARPKESGS